MVKIRNIVFSYGLQYDLMHKNHSKHSKIKIAVPSHPVTSQIFGIEVEPWAENLFYSSWEPRSMSNCTWNFPKTEPGKTCDRASIPLGHDLLPRHQHGGGQGGCLQGLPEVEHDRGQHTKGCGWLHGGDVCYGEYLRQDQGNDLAPDQPGYR